MSRAKQVWENYMGLWRRLTGWRLFLFYFLHYTLLFVVLQHYIFSSFYHAEKSFMWRTDGLPVYFSGQMVYVSQTVRNGIQALLNGEGWTIPLYDFRRGVMKTFFEVEPIQWLAVFWPWDKIDVLYDILVLIRYYLIGVSFSVLGFYFKQRPLPVAIGAISYTFCGFSIYAGVRHPAFMAPMIFLPLLVIGAEQVLKGKRAFCFTGVVFFSLISSLYFSCMLAILIVLYIFIRYFCAHKEMGPQGFGQLVGRMALWGGLGIFLAGVVWVPTLPQMLGTGRIGRDIAISLKYGVTYYERCLTGLIVVPGDFGSWTCLGFSVLAIPAMILLMLDKRKATRSLKAIFLILTGMMCIPVVAYIMSGFNAYSNRWAFACALCVAFILTVELPQLLAANRRILAVLGGSVAVYIIVCYFVVNEANYHEEPLVLLTLSLVIVAMCYLAGNKGITKILPLCLAITCFSVNYSAYVMYDPAQRNYVSEFVACGAAYPTLRKGQYTSLIRSKTVEKDQSLFYVAGDAVQSAEIVGSFFSDLNGLSFYSSFAYESYCQLKNDLEVGQRDQINRDYGLDGRAPLLSLANVKYYALRETGREIWPYGMKEIDRIKNGDNIDIILENENALSTGYTYDSYIDMQEFETLPAMQKQEAMIQAVVLNSAPALTDVMKANDIEKASAKFPVEISCGDGVSWKDSKLTITKENATINLKFEGPQKNETYLRIVNFDSPKRFTLTVNTEKTLAKTIFTPASNIYDPGARTQFLYLGNCEEGFTSCTLNFPVKGTFTLDDLEIWCQPMDHYAEQIEALRAEALENVETNWRGLTGTISTTKDKFLCFSIPYDEGWSAYVDGEKVDLVQANIGFMGVELPAGDHDIELRYWTPGLTAGIVLSCIGVAGVVVMILCERKRKRNGESPENVAV